MNLLSWNCRGLPAPATMRELKELRMKLQPTIVFLMETRAPLVRVEKVRNELNYPNGFCVEAAGISGGLGLFWNNTVAIEIMESNQNYIHTRIEDRSNATEWFCTFTYANPVFSQRRHLWARISSLYTSLQAPWCVLGNFNEVLS